MERIRSEAAVVYADITNMTIGLFASKELKHFGVQPKYHFRFNRLDDIADDTGKKLLTAKRRANIKSLKRFVQANTTNNSNGKTGPVMYFKLEAPELGAKAIEKIAGELQVAEVTSKFIRFDNLSAIASKSLKHPIMGEDAFVFDYNNKDRFPKASLQLNSSTEEHFVAWYLTDHNGTRVESSSSGRNGQQRTIGFNKKIPDNGRLVIVVADFDKVRNFPFEFRNIELAK